MAGASIRIEGLSKRYGEFVAVDDLSLDLGAGEFVTLLGLSGSGKTTTLMAVAGFVEPDAGRIEVGGRNIVDLPPEKRDLGVVFQNYALFPHLNVFENVAFPLRMRRHSTAEIDKAVKRLLGVVGLEAMATRRIAALSGGQQQRVALARALVFEPPALLMDEPLGALDRTLRDQMQTEIKRIQRELGVTVLYVTHDQDEALALSDRIAVMAAGRICQLATPDEIYERPQSAFVAGFVGDSNFFDVDSRGAWRLRPGRARRRRGPLAPGAAARRDFGAGCVDGDPARGGCDRRSGRGSQWQRACRRGADPRVPGRHHPPVDRDRPRHLYRPPAPHGAERSVSTRNPGPDLVACRRRAAVPPERLTSSMSDFDR